MEEKNADGQGHTLAQKIEECQNEIADIQARLQNPQYYPAGVVSGFRHDLEFWEARLSVLTEVQAENGAA